MLQYIQKPSYYAFQVQNGRKRATVSSIVWNVRIHEDRISQHTVNILKTTFPSMNCSETGNQIQNNQEKYWHTKSNKNWAITVKTQKKFYKSKPWPKFICINCSAACISSCSNMVKKCTAKTLKITFSLILYPLEIWLNILWNKI